MSKLHQSEQVELTKAELEQAIAEVKLDEPYLSYNKTLPPDHDLRRVATPVIGTEYLRGDEWDAMFKAWIKGLKDVVHSSEFMKEQIRNHFASIYATDLYRPLSPKKEQFEQ